MKSTISKFILLFALAALFFAAFFASTSSAFALENESSNNDFKPEFFQDEPKMEKAEFNALIKVTNGEKKISNENLETDEDGLNAVFSHGNGTSVEISNVKISTKKNGSRGLYAAFGGAINAKNVEISTLGEHCAAFATDMGGGKIFVENGKARTFGKGSPVLYCTGNIFAKKLEGTAESSEIAVIEGKNSLLIENSNLTGGAGLDNEIPAAIMIYQSTSGDAENGTAFLTVKNSNLKNISDGPFIYSTNTKGVVNLSGTKISNGSGIFLIASGNDSKRGWGKNGENGAQIELNAEKQNIEGEIKVDKISSLNLKLNDKTNFKGFVDSEGNGKVSINISKKAKVEFTADSFFDKFYNYDKTLRNIKSNGHTIFYNKNNKENSYLDEKTIFLSDGGKLVPTEYEKNEKAELQSETEILDFSREKNQNFPPKDSNFQKDLKSLKDFRIPELASKTGELQVANEKAMLIDSENKITILKLMDKADKMNKGENQMQKPEDFSPFQMERQNGRPSGKNAPYSEFSPKEPPKENSALKKPPRPLTIEDLKKLSGKQVEIKGIQEFDGTFTVFEIAEK